MAKARRKKSRIYFSKKVENFIVKYNEESDPIKKSKIYAEQISVPLNKLVENIMNRFKYPYFKEVSEDLQSDVVSFLIMNMHKYEQPKGKAFSYFSIIAKNYLILGNQEYYKSKKIKQRIDIPEGDYVREIIDEVQEKRMNDDTPEYIELMVAYWDFNIDKIFTKRQEIMIADAILVLFKRSNSIENFNKKALYLMIREMTGLRTQYITSVVNKMKEHNVILMNKYNTDGYFDPRNCVISDNGFF